VALEVECLEVGAEPIRIRAALWGGDWRTRKPH